MLFAILQDLAGRSGQASMTGREWLRRATVDPGFSRSAAIGFNCARPVTPEVVNPSSVRQFESLYIPTKIARALVFVVLEVFGRITRDESERTFRRS